MIFHQHEKLTTERPPKALDLHCNDAFHQSSSAKTYFPGENLLLAKHQLQAHLEMIRIEVGGVHLCRSVEAAARAGETERAAWVSGTWGSPPT